jgi:hypothetical protein
LAKGCFEGGAQNDPVVPPGHYIVRVNGKPLSGFKAPGGRLAACIEGGIKGYFRL